MLTELRKKCILENKVISFDVYDTLVKRNVKNPTDVFKIVEENLLSKENIIIENFCKLRCEAYDKAYKKLGAKCTIDDIYENFIDIDKDILDIIKKIEIDVEKDVCVPNYDMIEVYKYALNCEKKILLITDMYLKKSIIIEILEKCGIHMYDGLFVSCEYGASKTGGELYDICRTSMNICRKEWIHFGDGWKNDIIRAKMKGISCNHISDRRKLDYECAKNLSVEERFIYSIQQSIIKNKSYIYDNEKEKLGFEVFGPLVYGFLEWLHQAFKEQKIQKIYFLSREGLLFRNLYKMLFPNDELEIHYLYVSRKSLVPATYWIKSDYEDIMNSISKSKQITVESQIRRWGLDPEDCKMDLEIAGLEITDILDGRTWKENTSLRVLFDLLQERIITASKERYVYLEKYLKQENFGGKCAIVDIGWNGCMQNALEKIASIWEYTTNINGFYMGINSKNLGVKLSNINGYIYEDSRGDINRYCIYSFAGPLELSLTASHDTTVGYKIEDSKAVPVFGKDEYIDADGKFSEELKYVVTVQKGIEEYVSSAKILNKYYLGKVTSEVAFRNCKLFGLSPRNKHLKIYESFGANDLGEEQHFVNPKYKKLCGEYSFAKGFWKSTWKSGFMKLVFKVPFPYYRIYIYMRKKIEIGKE